MNTDFVTKSSKPTGNEYLSASLEDVIDRANSKPIESEIPFVTALFAAKSHENQRKTSRNMLYVALVTIAIASLSLAQNYFSMVQNTKKERELSAIKELVSGQDKRITELQAKILSIEDLMQSLKSEREDYLGIIKNFTIINPKNGHNGNDKKHSFSIPPDTKAAVD